PTAIPGIVIGEFRIIAHIVARGVIKKFTVNSQFGLGPDFLEKQALPPAGVGDNQVWIKALGFEFFRTAKGGFATNDLGFEVANPGVDAFAICACYRVGDQLYTLPFGCRLVSQYKCSHIMSLGD